MFHLWHISAAHLLHDLLNNFACLCIASKCQREGGTFLFLFEEVKTKELFIFNTVRTPSGWLFFYLNRSRSRSFFLYLWFHVFCTHTEAQMKERFPWQLLQSRRLIRTPCQLLCNQLFETLSHCTCLNRLIDN